MRKKWIALLAVIAAVCLGAALNYPARYLVARYVNEAQLDKLRDIRREALEALPQLSALPEGGEARVPADSAQDATGEGGVEASFAETADGRQSLYGEGPADGGAEEQRPGQNAAGDGALAVSQAAEKAGPLPYYEKEPVFLETSKILPQYRQLYAENQDLVGWLLIEDLGIDYPVMQTPQDDAFYLHRDFYGRYNFNGQLILDGACDPYTPSYNLIIYGHNMNNGTMFGSLRKYAEQDFWRQHKLVEFDSLMERRQYVIAAVFFGAEYAEGQEGFRYALDFKDEGEYAEWMRQVEAVREYDTGVDCAFGDEFITLSTCAYHVKNGRFAVVARRLRPGERYENDLE